VVRLLPVDVVGEAFGYLSGEDAVQLRMAGLDAFRYLSLIAVSFTLLGSALMFLIGAVRTINAGVYFLTGKEFLQGMGFESLLPAGLARDTAATINLIGAVDAFLFGLVLLIFSFGVYGLFVQTAGAGAEHPSVFRIRDIADLKTSLAQVIIIILFVQFLELVQIAGYNNMSIEALVIPAGIVCLGLGLYLMHRRPP